MKPWSLPYIDQPVAFWQELADTYGDAIGEVYMPWPGETLPTGRPPQPSAHLHAFLREAPVEKNVLLNPIILPVPADELASEVIATLRRFGDDYGVRRVTVTSLKLARMIKQSLPEVTICASTLMGIRTPAQAVMVRDWVDVLTPDNTLVRDLAGLTKLRAAFGGNLRLLVNEACIPGCPFRTQHFTEMAYSDNTPESLCLDMLHDHPWLRLTGAWVLPRHLYHYDDLVDAYKLAGRVSLSDPVKFRRVLKAYVHREPLLPHEIGGGPGSLLLHTDVSDAWFDTVLHCDKSCADCDICRSYYDQLVKEDSDAREKATAA